MRMQTEIVQVNNDPQIINEVNSNAAIWGWSVLNIQITDQKIVREGDSHGQPSFFGDKYIIKTEVITERTSYASITYQRDLDDPRVAKLADLEKDYNNCDRLDYLGENDTEVYRLCQQSIENKERLSYCAKACFYAAIASLIIGLITGSDLLAYLLVISLPLSIILKIITIVSPNFIKANKKIAELDAYTEEQRAIAKHRIKQEALGL